MNLVECSAGDLFCPQPDMRFLVEYVRRDYAMLTRTARVNRHLKDETEFYRQPYLLYIYLIKHALYTPLGRLILRS